jgi:hypothetical protein
MPFFALFYDVFDVFFDFFRDQEVAGSNPVSPTVQKSLIYKCFLCLCSASPRAKALAFYPEFSALQGNSVPRNGTIQCPWTNPLSYSPADRLGVGGSSGSGGGPRSVGTSETIPGTGVNISHSKSRR